MTIKTKTEVICLFILSAIAIAFGMWFGTIISDCPTCLGFAPAIFLKYAIIITLVLIPLILLFRHFGLEKDDVMAKKIFSGIAKALVINLFTGAISFTLGSFLGFAMAGGM